MARTATGVLVEHTRRRSPTFGLRFQAYGKRRYVTLGSREDGWDRAKAERELQHILADVDRGKWQPGQRRPGRGGSSGKRSKADGAAAASLRPVSPTSNGG